MVETTLQRLLEETHYDTVHNFEEFYKSFKRSHFADLPQFFQNYVPPINRKNHMCVSLAMETVTRLSAIHSWIGDYFFLVSCEEAIEISSIYVDHFQETAGFTLEKEHTLLAMKVLVAGREGILLLDAGYHIARGVTVMKDQMYPHTGWFTQSDESTCKREYNYTFDPRSSNFIIWAERQTRESTQQHEMSLVYVGKAYRTAVDVTVRRNLVYNFRSLLSRNTKGRVCAGIYFPVVNSADAQLTLFYDGPNGTNVKIKQKFAIFKDLHKVSVDEFFKNLSFY
jgi:hypothetical protein